VAKLLLAFALVLSAHFAMTFNVPAKAGKAWVGWPFATGETGWLDRVAAQSGHAPAANLLAGVAAVGFVTAIFSVFGLWIPQFWWPALASVAAISSLLVMGTFFSPNKLPAIALDLVVIAVCMVGWL
jgi:hypothetical protein